MKASVILILAFLVSAACFQLQQTRHRRASIAVSLSQGDSQSDWSALRKMLEDNRIELLKYKKPSNPIDWLRFFYLLAFGNFLTDQIKSESKEIKLMLPNPNDGVINPFQITRGEFESHSQPYIFRNSADKIATFDDLQPGKTYYASYKSFSFDGYAAIQGGVQTVECVNLIIDGDILIPLFSHPDTYVDYTYQITPPDAVSANITACDFPIRPHAVLMNGDSLLLLECKHGGIQAEDYLKFRQKIDFIAQNINQPYVTKWYPSQACGRSHTM